ncbi:class I SAM-dependent methyltransferase [Micromonospora sp. DT229]|uniref:class I SAM-dependent methyltransferase n=1 Tax=Micromonospora sp. DT229 TaxID=3393430 RepID=UPI003CFBBD23
MTAATARRPVVDRFGPLYPASAMALPVIPRLPMPRLAAPPPDVRNLSAHYRDHYGPHILREYPVGDSGDRIVVVDKAFPHSVYDMMLLATVGDDTVIASSVSDVPEAMLTTLLTFCGQFVRYVHASSTRRRFGLDGAQLMIGTNYDPSTTDRDNGQWWDKRMHWHLNCWPTTAYRDASMASLGDVNDVNRRRALVDPIAHLAARIMRDAIRTQPLPTGCRLADDTDLNPEGGPVGFKIALPGWDFLPDTTCARLLVHLHDVAAGAYAQLRRCFTGSPAASPPWTRPGLLPPGQVAANLDELTWLSEPARQGLRTLRSLLRDVTTGEMNLMRADMDLANRCLTLAGLDYHLGFWSPPQPGSSRGRAPVYLVMQFKLLSAIGSSPAIGGSVASILDRFRGPIMSAQQTRLRRQFQDRFLALLDCHTEGVNVSNRMPDAAMGTSITPEILAFYAHGAEQERLNDPRRHIEYLRTIDILTRHLPTAGIVADVGGGPGAYALRLAADGHRVHLVDPVPLHLEQAEARCADAESPLASILRGDARRLPLGSGSCDTVLLLGPLYHLTDAADRARAWAEAHRVLVPGGVVAAAATSRFYTTWEYLAKNLYDDPAVEAILARHLCDGQHRNPTGDRRLFTTGYFHSPRELAVEASTAGLRPHALLAVEGAAKLLPDLAERLRDPHRRDLLLRAMRRVEAEPSLLGMSEHILLIAHKPAPDSTTQETT